MVETKSSSESIPVIGVGGAGWVVAAEATARLLGSASPVSVDILASAAFRFLVVGGILSVGGVGSGECSPSTSLGLSSIGSCFRARRAIVEQACFQLIAFLLFDLLAWASSGRNR